MELWESDLSLAKTQQHGRIDCYCARIVNMNYSPRRLMEKYKQ
jgi:hypothetical protein